MKTWKQIYKNQGIVQDNPSQQIIRLVRVLKKEEYKGY